MAVKGSVSPKERVNIVYRSEIGDSKEEVELPLKVLVLGDFSFKESAQPMEDREIVSVDKDNFDDILEGHDLNLDIEVEDKLSGKKDKTLPIHLDFNSIKDFNPDNIINQVPALQKVVDLRNAIISLKGPLGNIPAFRKQIQSILGDDAKRDQLMKELGIK